MSGGIFLVRDDDELVEMTEQPYNSEDILQDLLAKYPNLLAGDQMDSEEPRRWLLVTREMGLPSNGLEGNRWSVDHLFLDQDGIPTLVEVKRSSDTRLRREVVGQLLEYAAHAISYWPVERIVAELEQRCERENIELESELANILIPDDTHDDYWERVQTNLQAGRIRLVFVADVIPRELRTIVEFLNEQMDPADVFAVEVKQFVGGDLKTLVPRLIGATERKRGGTVSKRRRRWTEAEFFDQMESLNGIPVTKAARELLDKLRFIEGMDVWWGRGRTTGSFVPRIWKNRRKYQLFTMYSAKPRIEFGFGVLKNRPEFKAKERREDLRQRLNALEGIDIPEEGIEKYPSILVEPMTDRQLREGFLEVMHWLIEEIRKK